MSIAIVMVGLVLVTAVGLLIGAIRESDRLADLAALRDDEDDEG